MTDGDDTMQVAPKVQLYTSKIDELNYKMKVTSTLKLHSRYHQQWTRTIWHSTTVNTFAITTWKRLVSQDT